MIEICGKGFMALSPLVVTIKNNKTNATRDIRVAANKILPQPKEGEEIVKIEKVEKAKTQKPAAKPAAQQEKTESQPQG